RRRLARRGDMREHEAPAAEIAGARQRDGERETHRDGGVDRVAAPLQDIEAYAGRSRLLAHDHPVPPEGGVREVAFRQDRRLLSARLQAEEGDEERAEEQDDLRSRGGYHSPHASTGPLAHSRLQRSVAY